MPSNTNSHNSGTTKPSKQITSKTTTNTGAAKGVSSTKPQANTVYSPKASSPKELSLNSVTSAVQDFIKTTNQLQAVNLENPMDNVTTGINKKKQKRRQKQAARLAAEKPPSESNVSQGVNGRDVQYHNASHESTEARGRGQANGYDYGASDYEDPEQYEPAEGEDLYFTDDEGRLYRNQDLPRTNGHDHMHADAGSKAKKKKKNKASSVSQHGYPSNHNTNSAPPSQAKPPPPPPPPPLSTATLRSAHHISKDRIWNTSTAEERERIKEFWLSLGEEDRRSLVKVEKEAVLKKMKEQQKHSCSCTVCGRKRTAIEEELEVLYDAYYEELEQYANNQHISLEDGTPIIPHPRMYSHPMARMPPSQNPQVTNSQRLSTGRVQEVDEDEEEGDDEEYSDEDEDDEPSEEETEEMPPGPAADFFNFGNSLTVQGGILTVADDLLKNDGKKFIEMMEQLAERRMQREEEAQYAAAGLGHASIQSHNHGPPLDGDDYDDDDDDEEYDSQDDEEYDDDDEMETLTEEQRMEEGRRMFQIFAARMFEQRVLTAYREKVANERQQKLIEELEEESRLDTQREAKKAKEAQKKKDKKRQQKQIKDEERAKREAEKAAEEAEVKAAEEKKAEEQRQKKEEQRRKREAEKKAQDEERQRRESEKQKRLQEAREQQAELERKQKEQKEREKKKRDEAKKKEREERETKEKEAREKKERDAAEKKEREARAKAAQEAKERSRKDEQVIKVTQGPPTSPLKHHVPLSAVPISSAFYPSQTVSNHASPHLQIATPVVPKAPTPVRPRQTSFQGSHNSSPKTSQAPGSSVNSPSLPSLAQNGIVPIAGKAVPQTPLQQTTPTFPPIGAPPGTISQPPGFSGMPTMVGNNFPLGQGPMLPPQIQRPQMHDPMMHPAHPLPHQFQFNPNQYRNFMSPNSLPFPPGMNGMRPLSHARGTMDPPLSQASAIPVSPANVGSYIPRDSMPSHSHSRNTSASVSNFEVPSTPTQTQPIARPTPIHRPSSVAPNQQPENTPAAMNSEMDDLSNHLGSSALLDDTDIAMTANSKEPYHTGMAPGPKPFQRGAWGLAQYMGETVNPVTNSVEKIARPAQDVNVNTWNSQPMPFGSPVMSSPPKWPAATENWSGSNQWGIIGGPNRPNTSRAAKIRQLACRAYTKLQNGPPSMSAKRAYCSAEALHRELNELIKLGNEGPVSLKEMLEICEMEGNAQNGGGAFKIEVHEGNELWLKYDLVKFDGRKVPISTRGAPGDIGSPAPSPFLPSFGAARASHQTGGVMSPTGF